MGRPSTLLCIHYTSNTIKNQYKKKTVFQLSHKTNMLLFILSDLIITILIYIYLKLFNYIWIVLPRIKIPVLQFLFNII